MKKRFNIAILLILAFSAASALAESGVEALHLRKINNETVLKIDLSGPFQFSHQSEVAKDGKPNRIIVDLFPAVHKLGHKVFAQLPPSLVTSIRTSQFAVQPEKVVRVVLDLQEQAIYRIEKSGNFVFIYIPDNSPDFAEWASNNQPETAKPVEKSVTEPAVAVEQLSQPTETAVIEKPAAPEDNPPIQTPAVEAMTSVEAKEPTETVTQEELSPEEPNEMATVENLMPQRSYSRPQQSRFIEEEMAKSYSPVVAQAAPPESPVLQPEIEPTAAIAVSPETTEASTAVESTVVAAVEPEAVPQAESVVVPTPQTAPLPAAETKVTDSSVKGSEVALKTQDLYHDTGVLVQEISPDDLPAIDPTALAEASLEDSTGQKPTSRFRRDGYFPAKLKGTIVAEFPQRMVIEYAPGVFRDPFETLINETKQNEGPQEKRIPDVETSRLVGILESSSGKNRALLEDLDGYGYILKAGDKVKKGYVERIDSDKAFFQLFEYGWSRTIALYLGRN